MLDLVNDIELTPEQVKFSQEWLSAHTYMIAKLGDEEEFPEHKLLWLFKTELHGKRRKTVLKRLFARHGILQRRKEWEKILYLIGE